MADIFAANGLEVVGDGDVVLDVGCGTGLAGQALRRHDNVTIDGIDISAEMLCQAATKKHNDCPVYRHLIEADLTLPLDIPDGAYAAAISTGTFTHGHVGPEALFELVRIIRPGGAAAIGVNAAHFAAGGFGPVFDQLVSDGRISGLRLIESPIYEGGDMHDADQYAHIAVFTRAAG